MADKKNGVWFDSNVKFFKGYMGNDRLKPPGVVIDFTPEQAQEWIRCANDPLYFINTYVKIIQADKGVVPFKTWSFQDEFINKIHNNRWVLAKMSRQIGKTVSTTSYLLWYIIFNDTKVVAIMSNKLDGAVKVLRQLKQSYELLPKWLQQGVVKWAERSIILENGSRAFASGTTAAGIRGETANIIYCDEFAFVPHNIQEQFYESVYPTITSGDETKIIITSTPKGLEMFYKFWTDSEQGENFYVRSEGYWHQVPGRDEKWKRETIANIGEQRFLQEFDAQFMGSALTLIHGPKLATLVYKKPEVVSDAESLHIFEKPEKGHVYAMTVDVAQGVGGDNSAFSVFDITKMPYKVVATFYNNKIQPMQFPSIIYRVAKEYNDANVLIELNDNGDQVANILHYEFEYEHIFMSTTKQTVQEIGGGFGKRTQMGVRMTKSVKRTGCATLKTLVEMDKLLVTDKRIINELANFVEKGSSHKAAPGFHDDLAMTLVIFAWLTLQPYFMEMTDSDTARNVRLDSARMIEAELTPFGDVITGLDTPEFTNRPSSVTDEWERRFNEGFYGSETPIGPEFMDELRSKYLNDDPF